MPSCATKLAGALVAFAAALALPVDAKQFRPALQAQLEKALARAVDSGTFTLDYGAVSALRLTRFHRPPFKP